MSGTTTPPGQPDGIPPELQRILDIINGIAIGLFVLVGIAVVGVAIYIGFKMATATDDSKRKDAKKQLIYAIVGVAGVIILIILWSTILGPALVDLLHNPIEYGGE